MTINPDSAHRLSIQEVLEHPWFDILKDDSTDGSQEGDEHEILEALANFSGESKFTKACMKLLFSTVRIHCNYKIRQEFSKINEKQNAIISKEELRNAFDKTNLNITDKEIKSIIGEVNFLGSQYINYSEFCMAAMNKAEILNDKNCKILFNIFDSENKGTITQSDIVRELEKSEIFSKNTIKGTIKDLGIDKNTSIDLEGFKQILFAS